jgi:hypothetical protein
VSQIPDSITPIPGWRLWNLGYKSGQWFLGSVGAWLCGPWWPPRQRMEAVHSYHTNRHPDPAPRKDCQCGLYAWATPERAYPFWDESDVLLPPPSAFGIVAGWGRVIIHERGDWRSQYAYPQRLALHCRYCFDRYHLLLLPAQHVLVDSQPICMCDRHYEDYRSSIPNPRCIRATAVEHELAVSYGIELISPGDAVWGPRRLPPEVVAAIAAAEES